MATTALYALHQLYQAKIIAFAGYQMPLQYQHGIIHEHIHTRTKAGLFDISHMGQIVVSGPTATQQLSQLMPSDLTLLPTGCQQYTVLTNAEGGIIDDLIVSNTGSGFKLVVNAANKSIVLQYLQHQCGQSCSIIHQNNQALLALQGPLAESVLKDLAPGISALRYMQAGTVNIDGIACWVSRSGYTGEDGFEISLPSAQAETLAQRLLQSEHVELIGLGARDTLRMEAGLCLYGNELDASTNLIEAGLGWIQTPRHQNYPGATVITRKVKTKQRLGLRVKGKIPVRKGAVVYTIEGDQVGTVTSGSYAPTIGSPIAMAYVNNAYNTLGTQLFSIIRNKQVELTVCQLPFIPHRYCRKY